MPAFFAPETVCRVPAEQDIDEFRAEMIETFAKLLDRLTDAIAALGARVFGRPSHRDEPEPVYALPSPRYEAHLTIPVCDDSPCRTAALEAQERGQFLARQDRWDDLLAEIEAADHARTATCTGLPLAEVLAFGARADVVLAAEHALQDGTPADTSILTHGIQELEAIRFEAPDNPYMALILAQAHLDIGWAWRGTGWNAQVPKLNREKCVAHFDRAAELMAPHNGLELDSPLVAAAHCALLAGQRDPTARVADDYEDLIDLDPHNPRHMRSLGYHLLPRWFGTYGQLELEARRTAARTQDIWGAGGYTWVCFDAISIDCDACAKVDVGFFIDGLRDIVARRPEQEMINLLAAYCAVAIRQCEGDCTESDLRRLQIADCAGWLIRHHLREIHPLIWAHAYDGFDNNARVTSVKRFSNRGKRFALQAIGELFREDIGNGRHVTFTDEGPRLSAA